MGKSPLYPLTGKVSAGVPPQAVRRLLPGERALRHDGRGGAGRRRRGRRGHGDEETGVAPAAATDAGPTNAQVGETKRIHVHAELCVKMSVLSKYEPVG